MRNRLYNDEDVAELQLRPIEQTPVLPAVEVRASGWGAPTGTEDRTTFVSYTAPDMDAAYNETQAQDLADHVQILSEHLAALVNDLKAKGELDD